MVQQVRPHVLLTGASSGIGAALAIQYATRRQTLTLVGRDEQRLDEVARRCRDVGASVRTVRADVRDRIAMAAVVHEASAAAPLTHVIANAGLGGRASMPGVRGEDAELAAQLVETNLSGMLFTVLPALAGMLERGNGQVTMIGSLAGYVGLPQSPVYSATKAAVRVYGDGLRRQLRGTGVTVTVASPGFVDTPMSRSLPFRPPSVWSAEQAADRIASAADAGKAEVAFPRHLALAVRSSAWLPRPVVDALLAMASRSTRRR